MKILLLLGLLLSLVSTSYAGPQDGQKRERMGNNQGHMGKMFKELNLTEDQQEKMKSAMKEQREKTKSISTAIKESREGLKEVMFNDDFNESKATEYAKKIGELTTKRILARISFTSKIQTILNKEQMEKMRSDMKERSEKRQRDGKNKRNGRNNQ